MENLPEPFVTEDSVPFWEAAGRGEFVVQRCAQCNRVQWYPRARCRYCYAWDMRWERDTGHASLYSFTVVRRAADRAFNSKVPYVVAMVELEAGFRMISHVVNAEPEDISIGMPLRVTFRPQGSFQLPVFEPALVIAPSGDEHPTR